MKLPRTGNRSTERVLIDDAFDAYLEWRDESAEVWHAYRRWNGAPAREARNGIPGPHHPPREAAASEETRRAGARIAGLKVTQSAIAGGGRARCRRAETRNASQGARARD